MKISYVTKTLGVVATTSLILTPVATVLSCNKDEYWRYMYDDMVFVQHTISEEDIELLEESGHKVVNLKKDIGDAADRTDWSPGFQQFVYQQDYDYYLKEHLKGYNAMANYFVLSIIWEYYIAMNILTSYYQCLVEIEKFTESAKEATRLQYLGQDILNSTEVFNKTSVWDVLSSSDLNMSENTKKSKTPSPQKIWEQRTFTYDQFYSEGFDLATECGFDAASQKFFNFSGTEYRKFHDLTRISSVQEYNFTELIMNKLDFKFRFNIQPFLDFIIN